MELLTNLLILFLEAAPYLVVGFVVAGVLHQYLSPRFVQKHLGGDSWYNIIKASIVGTPVPLCSCGVVPVGLGLKRDGASDSTAISFLIATPENGVESISLTYSFFGLPFTITRVVFSILVANITAFAVALFGKPKDRPEGVPSSGCCAPKPVEPTCCSSKPVETTCCSSKPVEPTCCSSKSATPLKRNGFRFVVHEFVPAIARWVVIGFVLSAAITTFLPSQLLEQLDSRWAVPLAALIGVPMYVCASASTPIAYSLFVNGLSPGACLAFLLTGPATNSANFPLYLKTFGARTTAIYYGGIYFVSVALSLLIDAAFAGALIQSTGAAVHHHFHPGWPHYVGGVVLFVLLAHGIVLEMGQKKPHHG